MQTSTITRMSKNIRIIIIVKLVVFQHISSNVIAIDVHLMCIQVCMSMTSLYEILYMKHACYIHNSGESMHQPWHIPCAVAFISACVFHVTCMDLGHFPCMLHACYMKNCMHATCTCIQQFSFKICLQNIGLVH